MANEAASDGSSLRASASLRSVSRLLLLVLFP